MCLKAVGLLLPHMPVRNGLLLLSHSQRREEEREEKREERREKRERHVSWREEKRQCSFFTGRERRKRYEEERRIISGPCTLISLSMVSASFGAYEEEKKKRLCCARWEKWRQAPLMPSEEENPNGGRVPKARHHALWREKHGVTAAVHVRASAYACAYIGVGCCNVCLLCLTLFSIKLSIPWHFCAFLFCVHLRTPLFSGRKPWEARQFQKTTAGWWCHALPVAHCWERQAPTVYCSLSPVSEKGQTTFLCLLLPF